MFTFFPKFSSNFQCSSHEGKEHTLKTQFIDKRGWKILNNRCPDLGSILGPFSQKRFRYVTGYDSLWQKESLLTRSVPKKAFVSFLIFGQIISILTSACYQDMYRFPAQKKTYLWTTHFLLSKCRAIFYVQKSNLFPERSNSGKMHQKYIQKNTMNRSHKLWCLPQAWLLTPRGMGIYVWNISFQQRK